MEEMTEIDREDEHFLYGSRYVRRDKTSEFKFVGKFMQLKKTLWLSQEPVKILAEMGIKTEVRRAVELSNFFDGRLSGYYYIEAASDGSDEAIKWVLGALAEHINKNGLSGRDIGSILPADHLRAFVSDLKAEKFARSFSKDVFAALIRADKTDDEVRVSGVSAMSLILSDPKYKPIDSSVIDGIIDSVIAANQEQAGKVAEQPKLLQWFLGNVMKQAKGAASPQVITEKLKERFGL